MWKMIMRNTIRKDVLFFALPALLVCTAGLAAMVWDLAIVGLALIVIGGTLSLVAAVTLRRFYSSALIIREDHQLITHGVYRLTRHPIYLGTIMVLMGVPMTVSSLYGLLTMSALIPLLFNRIRMEEEMLTEEFGDTYRRYQEATSKLIPFIC
jgi:protein-S-isoprenylcysteine O-methyltransferase Ste14